MAKERPRRLDLSHQNLSDDELNARAEQGVFEPDVGELNLDGNRLTARSLDRLAETAMNYVRALSIAGNQLGDEGALVLSQRRMFAGLKSLVLSQNELTGAGAAALFGRDSHLSGPFWLILDDNHIGDEGVVAIVTDERARFLQTLSLENANITDRGAQFIAASPFLLRLLELNLRGNPITEPVKQLLRDAPHFRSCSIAI